MIRRVLPVLAGLLFASSAFAADVTLLNVSYDPTRELYEEYNALFSAHWQKEHGITYPSVHDGSGSVLAKWGGLPIPRIFFVARSGKVVGELIVEEDLPRYLRQIAAS